MRAIDSIEALEALYGTPGEASLVKVTTHLIPAYRKWIARARFCVISTVGPEGTDASPRGDTGPVVTIAGDKTLHIPDWRGNNRLDSLRNIIRDPRLSLLFLVAGSSTVLRVNGTALVTADADLCASFEHAGKTPRSVIVVTIGEVYPQCARAVIRSGIWTDGDHSHGLPSVGDMLREATSGEFDGASYDRDWPARAKSSLW